MHADKLRKNAPAGAVEAALGRDSRAPDDCPDRLGAQAFPGGEPEHFAVSLAQCSERRRQLYVGGDMLGMVRCGDTGRLQTCPVIQPTAAGEGPSVPATA